MEGNGGKWRESGEKGGGGKAEGRDTEKWSIVEVSGEKAEERSGGK